MANLRLPNPPTSYEREWANQYTRQLEAQNQTTWNALQALLLNVLPTYTTAEKNTLSNREGQMIYDSDLKKACINTGSGWETISSS